MAEQPPFTYVYGPDDFLVARLAKRRWEEMTAGAADAFAAEVIDGQAGTVEEVERAVNRFREAAQTLGLFGGRRLVWLKGVSFLADTITGRAEGTQALCEELREILEGVDPAEVGALISASPVDGRKRFAKWLAKTGESLAAGGVDSRGKGGEALIGMMGEACAERGVSIEPGAAQALLAKVGASSRLLMEEIDKLATYLGEEGGTIDARLVGELVPNFGDGDFFEATEAFFARDLDWTLHALRRHFFAGGVARPVLASLQNRNRLLIQLRALVDGGEIRIGPSGIGKAGFERAAASYAERFGGSEAKSGFRVFSQNLWYLGKLYGASRPPPLKRLVDHQLAFVETFATIVERPREEEETLRGLAIRCLA